MNSVKEPKKSDPNQILYDFQLDAMNRMFTGCILNGGTGSGKSLTGLFYYMKKQGGWIDKNGFTMMKDPQDLYIITEAKKKHDLEWESDLAKILLSTNPEDNKLYNNKVVVDSWQCIKKYINVTGAMFIFDEDHLTGSGSWVKSFLKIAKNNDWFIASATPGDQWLDYAAVFIANGFYRNFTEFKREHVVYNQYAKFPQVDRYINDRRLYRLREKILIDMEFERHTVRHYEDVYATYDVQKYKSVFKNRWNPFTNEPVEQASSMCYVLRKIVNLDISRQVALLELLEDHPKAIIFYNFDDELEVLLNLAYIDGTKVAQYNGHKHEPIPIKAHRWVYLCQYNSCAAWNCIYTDTVIFYSQTYSYKTYEQCCGRIDRVVTPFTDLYYYNLKSRSGIDLAISKALSQKKKFNERKFVKWD